MTIKLTKKQSTEWQGNGLGTTTAEWTLASDPQWSIWAGNSGWVARHPDGSSLRGYNRTILMEKLERLLGVDA